MRDREREAEINLLKCEIVNLRHAAWLLYRRHAMISGSVEMAECDKACTDAGLAVWTWPPVAPPVKAIISPLDPVLDALVEASNALNDIDGVKELCIYTTLDLSIDAALRIVQAWMEEERDGRGVARLEKLTGGRP